jgi:hypothetical protein
MKDREPTVRSRELGDGLRRAMECAGYNGTQIAGELGWSQGRVSRLLAGKRGGSGFDVSAFLAVCGIKNAERDRLLTLSGDYNRLSWLVQHGQVAPKQVQTIIDYEARSAAIVEFQNLLIPVLLQTSEYARAVLSRSANIPQEDVDDRVQARLTRQEVISRPHPPSCTFFLHEYALRAPIGGAAIMSDQLHYLLRTAVRPNVTLRVVPASVGAHAGMTGHFTLMDTRGFKPIVHIESETCTLFLETPMEINAYRNIVASLNKIALDNGSSKGLIASMAAKFGEE